LVDNTEQNTPTATTNTIKPLPDHLINSPADRPLSTNSVNQILAANYNSGVVGTGSVNAGASASRSMASSGQDLAVHSGLAHASASLESAVSALGNTAFNIPTNLYGVSQNLLQGSVA
jgi:hypothetical protein